MSIVIAAYPAPLDRTGTQTPADEQGRPHTLYLALAPDAPFAAIDVVDCGSADGVTELVRVYRSTQPAARAGRYDVIDVGGQLDVAERQEDQQAITFINCFEVEPGREEEALTTWREFNAYFVVKPGYVSHRLHRGDDDADFRYVNVVRWASMAAWGAAHDAGFRAMAARPLPFVSLPTVCRAARAQAGIPS